MIEMAIEIRFVRNSFFRIFSPFHLSEECLKNSKVSKVTAIKIPKIEVVEFINNSKKLDELIEERLSKSNGIKPTLQDLSMK